MTAEQLPALERIVLRGLQAGISSCEETDGIAPQFVAMLHAGLHRLLIEVGALVVRVAGDGVTLNDRCLDLDEENLVVATRLSRALRDRQLEGVRIEPGLGVTELHNALKVLAAMHEQPDAMADPRELFLRTEVENVVPLREVVEKEAWDPDPASIDLVDSSFFGEEPADPSDATAEDSDANILVTEAEPDAEVEAEAEVAAELDVEVEAEADAHAEVEVEVQAHAELDTGVGADVEAEAEADVEVGAEEDAVAEFEAHVDADADVRVETAAEPRFEDAPKIGLAIHRRRAQQLYRRGLRLYANWCRHDEPNTQAQLLETRRLLQRIIDLAEEDDTCLIGLTCVDNPEGYAQTHAVNVAVLSLALGRTIGLNRLELLQLGMAAFLHGIGDKDIPEDLLTRRGALTEEEWLVMRRHTLQGAARLLELGSLDVTAPVALVALEHHMGVANTGYPSPARTPLSVASRIVQIADTYDALTSRRVYRQRPVPPDRAIAYLFHHGDEPFDPVLVYQFARTLGLYPPGTAVRLDDGRLGIVVKANRDVRELRQPHVCLLGSAPDAEERSATIIDLSDSQESGDSGPCIQESVDARSLGFEPISVFVDAP